MGKGLEELRAKLQASGGYTNAPEGDDLNDLKVSVNHMMDHRDSHDCSAHVNTQYDGKLSVSDIEDHVDTLLLGCACNAEEQLGCTCDLRTQYCICESETSAYPICGGQFTCRPYAINGCNDHSSCSCQSRGGSYDDCTCDSRGVCDGVSDCQCDTEERFA